MRVHLANLYSKERPDGAITLKGRMGFDGYLVIEPNPDYNPEDVKSPPFVAFLQEAPPKNQPRYQGPQLAHPQARPQGHQPRALGQGHTQDYEEGEIVDR